MACTPPAQNGLVRAYKFHKKVDKKGLLRLAEWLFAWSYDYTYKGIIWKGGEASILPDFVIFKVR